MWRVVYPRPGELGEPGRWRSTIGRVSVKTRIFLADDHPLVLAGVRSALEADGGFEVIGETGSAEQVLPLIRRLMPDVVLLGGEMPGIDPVAFLDRALDIRPALHVILFSSNADPDRVQTAFSHRAAGYVLRSIEPADLPSAIRQAIEGTAFHARGLPALTEEAAAKATGLTVRELTVVKAVTRGLSNRAIARELWITEQTVKFHLGNVYRKLGISNRTEAARWVLNKGLEHLNH